MMNLFEHAAQRNQEMAPLAEKMRPQTLKEVLGQKSLARLMNFSRPRSCILGGPPGVGKTSVARLIASHYAAEMFSLSATAWSAKEYRQIVVSAQELRGQYARPTVIFVDEIHRLTMVQQDALLPEVESGRLTLIGATTENIRWALSPALLSRCIAVQLLPLSDETLCTIVRNANSDPTRGLGTRTLTLTDATVKAIAAAASGDARRALGILELIADAAQGAKVDPTPEMASQMAADYFSVYPSPHGAAADLSSAFIKSMRASDPDASLYYLARLLDTGTDPEVCLRRMLVFASEDVGLADPTQLALVSSAYNAFEKTGMPEGRLVLAHAATSLALCPKDRSIYEAFEHAAALAATTSSLQVPTHLRQVSFATQRTTEGDRNDVANKNLPQGIAHVSFLKPSRKA